MSLNQMVLKGLMAAKKTVTTSWAKGSWASSRSGQTIGGPEDCGVAQTVCLQGAAYRFIAKNLNEVRETLVAEGRADEMGWQFYNDINPVTSHMIDLLKKAIRELYPEHPTVRSGSFAIPSFNDSASTTNEMVVAVTERAIELAKMELAIQEQIEDLRSAKKHESEVEGLLEELDDIMTEADEVIRNSQELEAHESAKEISLAKAKARKTQVNKA